MCEGGLFAPRKDVWFSWVNLSHFHYAYQTELQSGGLDLAVSSKKRLLDAKFLLSLVENH